MITALWETWRCARCAWVPTSTDRETARREVEAHVAGHESMRVRIVHQPCGCVTDPAGNTFPCKAHDCHYTGQAAMNGTVYY